MVGEEGEGVHQLPIPLPPFHTLTSPFMEAVLRILLVTLMLIRIFRWQILSFTFLRIWMRIRSYKQDPDQVPDPYQSDADPQHCTEERPFH